MSLRTCLLSVVCLLSFIPSWGQGTSDFAGRFMKMNEGNDGIHCITVGPHMMEKMMKLSGETDNAADAKIKQSLAHCKSIRIVKARTQVSQYREKALDLLKKNNTRYHIYTTEGVSPENNDCLWTRKRGKNIVEVIILSPKDGSQFSVLNITGNLSDEFIKRILKD